MSEEFEKLLDEIDRLEAKIHKQDHIRLTTRMIKICMAEVHKGVAPPVVLAALVDALSAGIVALMPPVPEELDGLLSSMRARITEAWGEEGYLTDGDPE